MQAEELFEPDQQPTHDRWVLIGAVVVLVIALAIGIFAEPETSQIRASHVQPVTAIE